MDVTEAEELEKLFGTCEHPMAEYDGSVMEITAVIKRQVMSQSKGTKMLTSAELLDKNRNCVYIVRASKLNHVVDTDKMVGKK